MEFSKKKRKNSSKADGERNDKTVRLTSLLLYTYIHTIIIFKNSFKLNESCEFNRVYKYTFVLFQSDRVHEHSPCWTLACTTIGENQSYFGKREKHKKKRQIHIVTGILAIVFCAWTIGTVF